MKIAIIAAMAKEVDLLIPLLEQHESVEKENILFHTGRIGSHDVVIMQCGIGKVNAALATQTLINAFHPELVINSGVAGGTGSGANVLDVVMADSVAYHDFYCLCEPWGRVPGLPREFPTFPLPAVEGVRRGLIASGDLFVSKPEEVQFILSQYPGALAVDMESAAIAQTCYIKDTPFACIRVLSDTPGQHDDNASQYYDFWAEAPQKTFAILSSVISQIK